MYKTNNITSPNPDSSGASTSLEKNTKKKKKKKAKVRNAIQCTEQTAIPRQIPIPAPNLKTSTEEKDFSCDHCKPQANAKIKS